MNRLIILGNGFDLAHGLKTKYCDFIENYWLSIKENRIDDKFIEFLPHTNNVRFETPCKSLKEISNFLGGQEYINGRTIRFSDGSILTFKNVFFQKLLEFHSETNWVDIEMEYYNFAKNIIKGQQWSYDEENIFTKFKRLNKEIISIYDAFHDYLFNNVSKEIKKVKNKEFEELFKVEKISQKNVNLIRQQFSFKNQKKLFGGLNEIDDPYDFTEYFGNEQFDDTCILNFNYTNTINHYFSNTNRDELIINIHGEINRKGHPILLGFGDESDEYYKQIEDLNQNEYLRFMKSSHYLKNKNYKNLFDFIELGNFQVHLLGHSCALSDRTLLKAIFENDFCLSIKPYYFEYQKPNEYGEVNNYSEIVKNISRHFSNKMMMREKVVNFMYCDPLPQF